MLNACFQQLNPILWIMQVFLSGETGNRKQSSGTFIWPTNRNAMPVHAIVEVLDFENNQPVSKIETPAYVFAG